MVLPTWVHTVANSGHRPSANCPEAECSSSELAQRLQAACAVGDQGDQPPASAAVLARPTRDNAGTALLALDLQPSCTEKVYPYMYDEGGHYSITGNTFH